MGFGNNGTAVWETPSQQWGEGEEPLPLTASCAAGNRSDCFAITAPAVGGLFERLSTIPINADEITKAATHCSDFFLIALVTFMIGLLI
jgi:hypothetical protein